MNIADKDNALTPGGGDRREKKIVAVKRENKELKQQIKRLMETPASTRPSETQPQLLREGFYESPIPADALETEAVKAKSAEQAAFLGDRMPSPEEVWAGQASEPEGDPEQALEPEAPEGAQADNLGGEAAEQVLEPDEAASGGESTGEPAPEIAAEPAPEQECEAAEVDGDGGAEGDIEALLSETLGLLPVYPELGDPNVLRELRGIARRSGLSLKEVCRAKLPRADASIDPAAFGLRRRAYAACPPLEAKSTPAVLLSPMEQQQFKRMRAMFPHMTPERFKAISTAEINVDKT